MHSNYDNMSTNGIFNVLICINNHVNSYINYMLLVHRTVLISAVITPLMNC